MNQYKISDCPRSKYYTPGLFCNNKKEIEFNNKMYQRNFPSEKINVTYNERPLSKCCRYNNKCNDIFPSSCNFTGNYISSQNNEFNYKNKSIINPGKGTYTGYAENINIDSSLKGINSNLKLAKKYDSNINNINCYDTSYTEIGIKNSYPSCNLPYNVKDCNRNICLNPQPFKMCTNKNKSKKENNIINWNEYSKINDLTENMIENTTFYTDPNSRPFILNHIAVKKPKICCQHFCAPLFNQFTSANLINGRYIYKNLLEQKFND